MKRIRKILIANRGEIAVRIIRACNELGIKTVAVYSTADSDSLHVLLADEAVCIGDQKVENSYLNKNAILQAAVNTQSQAIHPGVGFLSEDATFARMCEVMDIKFIGPRSETIEMLGNKLKARKFMNSINIPIIPGTYEPVDRENACQISSTLGYPVLLKSVSGGGGNGIRLCHSDTDFELVFNQIQKQTTEYDNYDSLYIEKFLEKVRHFEVQILGDSKGNIIHLYNRECSVQLDQRKMIEEAPVKNISPKTEERLYSYVRKILTTISYESAGTIEFLMDENENLFFIEMNTRIQVEHPVTELITGVDIIKQQIRIAEGQDLNIKQNDVVINGHAIEIRINADYSESSDSMSMGTLTGLHFPGGNGVRVDSHMYQGYTMSPYYDSLMAKVIVHDENREASIGKGIRCLIELGFEGISTDVETQLTILLSDEFNNNNFRTDTLQGLIVKGALDV